MLPAKTSTGKWTAKYTLENAVNEAKRKKRNPKLFLFTKMESNIKALKTVILCPEGKVWCSGKSIPGIVLIATPISLKYKTGLGKSPMITFFNKLESPPLTPKQMSISKACQRFLKAKIPARITLNNPSPK